MKKYLLFAMAAVVAMVANATDFYLIGGFNNWTLEGEGCKFTDNGDGIYTLDFKGTLTSGFKINDGTWGDTYNFGGGNNPNLVVGEEFFYAVGGSSANITMSENVENPRIVLNTVAGSILVTGQQIAVEYAYVLHGNFDGSNSWADVALTEKDGVWTATVTADAACNFGIKKTDKSTGSQLEWISAVGDGKITLDTPIACKVEGTNFSLAKGEYTFTFNPESMTLTATGKVIGGDDPVIPVVDKKLYIVGDNYGNWGGDGNGIELVKGSDNIYRAEIAEGLSGKWKIWDGTWNYNFGGTENVPLEANKPQNAWFNSSVDFTLSTTGATVVTFEIPEGADVANSGVAAILTVTGNVGGGDDPVIPIVDRKLYIVGENYGNWGNDGNGVEMEKVTDNLYKVELADGLSGEWKIWDGTWNYNFGGTENVPLEANKPQNAWFNSVNFTLNIPSSTIITLEIPEGSDVKNSPIPAIITVNGDTTAVEAVEVAEGEVAYFNLQGVQVVNPAHGIYVKVVNGKASKVLINK